MGDLINYYNMNNEIYIKKYSYRDYIFDYQKCTSKHRLHQLKNKIIETGYISFFS